MALTARESEGGCGEFPYTRRVSRNSAYVSSVDRSPPDDGIDVERNCDL